MVIETHRKMLINFRRVVITYHHNYKCDMIISIIFDVNLQQ